MKRLRVPPFLVVIMLLALLLLPVHAATYVGYGAANLDGSTCGTNCAGNSSVAGDGLGQTIQAPFTGILSAAGFFTGAVVPNQIVILTYNTVPTINAYSCGSAGTCANVQTGSATATVADVEALSGLSGSTFFTVNLANPVSVTAGQYLAIIFLGSPSNSGMLMFAGTGGQTTTADTLFHFGTTNPSGSYSVSVGVGAVIVGGSFTPAGTIGANFQCYGNCGTPPVTLANTNSTHTTNFNQSITLLYIVQSNQNGFVANVTTRVAKNYLNGNAIAIGLYTVDPACTASALPFTPQCPGFLAQQQGLTTNPQKGNFVMKSNVAIINGQWFGLAVTGAFQGLDLNDTNKSVNLNQAAGQIPTSISQFLSLGGSNLALYAYIKGNQIISGPVNGQIPPGCQTVTCGLIAFWIAMGGDTAAGIGAFFVLLSILCGFFLYVSRQHNPDGSLKGFAIPMEFLTIIAVVLLLMLSVAGVLPPWIPAVIIFMVAGLVVVGIFGHRRHSNTVQG